MEGEGSETIDETERYKGLAAAVGLAGLASAKNPRKIWAFRIPRASHVRRAFTDRKVDFVIAGTQKGGTSALDAYLRLHPQLCMARGKEVHFFDTAPLYAKGEPDYALYHSFFKPKPQHQLIGEATPNYMYWPEFSQRLWRYNAAMKIILVLRNPIDRAYSNWNMRYSRGGDPLPFGEAIRCENERVRQLAPEDKHHFSYIDRGRYAGQILRLWRFFAPEQMLILKQETLRADHEAVLTSVCDFLGVSQIPNLEPLTRNSGSYEQPMKETDREYLRGVFEFEVRNLEGLLGWNCSDWLR